MIQSPCGDVRHGTYIIRDRGGRGYWHLVYDYTWDRVYRYEAMVLWVLVPTTSPKIASRTYRERGERSRWVVGYTVERPVRGAIIFEPAHDLQRIRAARRRGHVEHHPITF